MVAAREVEKLLDVLDLKLKRDTLRDFLHLLDYTELKIIVGSFPRSNYTFFPQLRKVHYRFPKHLPLTCVVTI
jgi:hypothetical protein